VFSDKWNEVADCLSRIASISQMVRWAALWLLFVLRNAFRSATAGPPRPPRDRAVCRAQEKEIPKEEGATLWDCEELALRYVLEDGKLNLCVLLCVPATVSCPRAP
jgi:hypothetical protein